MRVPLAATLIASLAIGAAPAAAQTRAATASGLGPVRAGAVRARAAAARAPTVTRVLKTLASAGAITPATLAADASIYQRAKHTLSRLSGTRRAELAAVLATVQEIAGTGQLTGTLQRSLFLTLQRNTMYWSSQPLLSYGQRVKFPPSELVWEEYPGQGLQIQWLATFGEGNGFFLSGDQNEQARTLIGEALSLADEQASGITWDYLLHFDGGAPPWTSGLTQGTALQLLSRAWQRYKAPEYLTAAQRSLGIFQTPPPAGVLVRTPTGSNYAEYSFAPGDHILNGFIQALVGLYDYASITRDPLGGQLFEAGDAQARSEVPHYDTGAWSLYDQYGESDLGYHELLTEFLQHLCERTSVSPPIPPPAPSAPAASPPADGTSAEGTPIASGEAPKSTTATAAANKAQTKDPIAGDQIYCTTAQHFREYLHIAPVITLLTRHLRTAERAGVKFELSKISTVTLTVRRGSRVVWTNTASVAGGDPRLLWETPAKGGTFSVTATATDLAGNSSTSTGIIVVARK